ncbi:MAG: HD domain-containing protein [Planctomycetaceae bacterium]|nr:HD domain-containing protein [Planctomycetaceae bacterium]
MVNHPYASIPEIARAGDSVGVIRIPSEQDVPFTRRVREIVDTPEFHRLSYITQLALTSRVYPGATHTRFEHALGVYHNAVQYLWQLGRDQRFAEFVRPRDAEILIVSALLHDVGHWPFCHPIEDMSLPGMPPHESFAREFLGSSSELAGVLRRSWGIDPDEILDVLVARSNSQKYRLMRSVLSGPIDIDKMDYLVRDSQHCGVPYGKHFDKNRLIASLIVNDSGDGLAISSKGKTAAEMMVFARYVMFTEVYWHHAVRAATTMFARSFYELHGQLDLEALFRLREPELIRTLCEKSSGTEVQSLTDGIFGDRRELLKRLAEFSVFHEEELYRSLRQLSYPRLAAFSDRLSEALAAKTGLPLSRLDVLIDAPPLHREVEFRVDIFSEADRTYRPLREVSPIVDAMARTQFDDCVKKVRIFGSGKLRQSLGRDNPVVPCVLRELLETAT